MGEEMEFRPIRDSVTIPASQEQPHGGLANVLQDARDHEARKNAAVLVNSFRRLEAEDPQVYTRALEVVFSRYDLGIQKAAADPSNFKYPPSAYEIREFCEAETARRNKLTWDDAKRETLARRQDNASAPREKRETVEQLKQRHGQDWGLSTSRPQRNEAREAELNAAGYADACRRTAAMWEADGGTPMFAGEIPISLALVKAMKYPHT